MRTFAALSPESNKQLMEEKKTTETPVLNAHNKEEHRPSHTCEHIVNQTMIRLFGCGRSVAAHIERKKSKLDYRLDHRPTDEEVKRLEDTVNEVIATSRRKKPADGSTWPACPKMPRRRCAWCMWATMTNASASASTWRIRRK